MLFPLATAIKTIVVNNHGMIDCVVLKKYTMPIKISNTKKELAQCLAIDLIFLILKTKAANKPLIKDKK